MPVWVDLLRAAAAVNVALLAAVTAVWLRNFRELRSKHTLGLAAFGLLLLVENALTVYVFGMHADLSAWLASTAPVAQRAMAILKLLEAGALAVLTWTTWD